MTVTQTRNRSNRHRRALSIEGKVAREEIITTEQTIVLTTELPADGAERAESDPETPTSGKGKTLVGPRGTFAYLLTRGDEKRPGYGDRERLVFFPDEDARVAFEEFGWPPLQEEVKEQS